MIFKPQVFIHDVLPSTMDEARRLAGTGANEGAVVQARAQSAGRGRFGNTWTSPEGNLYMTVLFRPQTETRYCAQLSFLCAVALGDALTAQGVPDVQLKWPNDVLVGGRKIAGILLEMQAGAEPQPDFLLAGIGVNVAVAPKGAAKVQDYAPRVDADALRDAVVGNIAILYSAWLREGFAPIRAAWLTRVYGMGQEIVARLADQRLTGVFDGIDAQGNLLLREDVGSAPRVIHSGAVHFRVG